jgi:cobalt-zinc-cadmium efflux system membrane fusion protein
VIAAGAILAFAGCSPSSDKSAQSGEAINVTLTKAQRTHIHLYKIVPAPFHKTVEATGVVDFDNDQSTAVLAPISGPVSRLLVTLGQTVKKGEALASVDSPDYATAIGAYRKSIVAATAARRVADMDKDLLKHQGVSQREAAQAEADAVSAEADRDAARQTLVSLNMAPKLIAAVARGSAVGQIEGMIRAPIAGTVVERSITPGQLLQAGSTPCFTVADLSRVWVMAQLFGSDLESVHTGDPVTVETGMGSKTFSGTVQNIASVVDPDTRSVAVRVVVRNPGEFLKKQMYVRVRIQDRTASTGLLAPVSAILRDDENLPFVYVVQADGSFARQRVSLGYRAGERYDIPHGLHAGDRIVVDGALFVQFMQSQ